MTTVKAKPASRSTAKAAAATAPKVAAPAPAAEAAPAEAVKQIENAVAASKETVESMVKASKDVADAQVGNAASLTRDQMEAAAKAQTEALKAYENAVAGAKENMDALVKAGNILSRGLQDMGKEILGLTQEGIDDSVAVSRQIMAAKTLREIFEIQSDVAKTAMDRAMAEGARLSDMSVRLAEEAMAPINDRFAEAMKKVGKIG